MKVQSNAKMKFRWGLNKALYIVLLLDKANLVVIVVI